MPTEASKRAIANFFILYGRMAFTMAISLLSTRLLLGNLGQMDYGLFYLLLSIVVLLSFLRSALSVSTQRFLSFYQGAEDTEKQRQVFMNSLTMHGLLAIALLLLLEGIGYGWMERFLTIPPERLPVAAKAYHVVVTMAVLQVLSLPFIALLQAHEKLSLLAKTDVSEAILRAGAAASLSWFASEQRLHIYAGLMAFIHLGSCLAYIGYCIKNYRECVFRPSLLDWSMIRQIGNFSGWNAFGTFCVLARTQGLAILLNVFFGPLMNAAYGIAFQVQGQLQQFSGTVLRVLNAQMIKSEGAGNRKRLLLLNSRVGRYSLFLFSWPAIPLLFGMHTLLKWWLGDAPQFAAIFAQYLLIAGVCKQFIAGIPTAIQAVGTIRLYQLFMGLGALANLPLAYLGFYLGLSPDKVLLSIVFIEILITMVRIVLGGRIIEMDIPTYFREVVWKGGRVVLAYGLVMGIFTCSFTPSEGAGLTLMLLAILLYPFAWYHFAIPKRERILLKGVYKKISRLPIFEK